MGIHETQEYIQSSSPSAASSTVSYASLASYVLGGIGDNVVCTMIVTFLMLYYTDYVGIPAATVGTIFLLTRIWDTFSDLVWGWIFDNTHAPGCRGTGPCTFLAGLVLPGDVQLLDTLARPEHAGAGAL